MSTSVAWQELLQHPKDRSHIVQAYSDLNFLAEAVGFFVGQGFDNQDGVVIVATPSHRDAFLESLKKRGYDTDAQIANGRLILPDAQELLNQFMHDGHPQEKIFNALVGGVIEKARPSGDQQVRAYGEMVNILYHQGNFTGAIELEELWNKLGQKLPFTLFCAYEIDPLDPNAYDGTLQRICKTHSHFIPLQDYAGLTSATDQAVDETIGRSLSGTLRALDSSAQSDLAEMPTAQSRLFWLKENIPGVGEKVIELARRYYRPSKSASF